MIFRFFDFEVFEDWWCCSFGDLPDDVKIIDESIKNSMVTITSDIVDAKDALMTMFDKAMCMTGYNIKGYDLMIANAIRVGFNCHEVKVISDIIINHKSETVEQFRLQPYAFKRMSGLIYQDLLDDGDGTLKEKENILGLDIEESEVPFDKTNLTDEEKQDVIKYNKHDVYASMCWFLSPVYQAYIDCKVNIGKKFNIDTKTVFTSTNPKLTCIAVKAKKRVFDDEEKVDITLPPQIEEYCYENCPSNVLEHLLHHKNTLSVKVFENTLTVADGGMHSTYPQTWTKVDQTRRDERKVLYVESDDDYVILLVDGKSYYPSLMIFLQLLTRCCDDPSIFKGIFDDRMTILAMNEIPLDLQRLQLAYKLLLNSMSGASDCKFLDAYDKYMTSRMRRVGQIFLSSLSNKVYHIDGTKIIQTNTDGIAIYIKRALLNELYAAMEEWTRVSGIILELDEIEKVWQKDVNNYLMIKKGGKIKRKGAWLNDTVWKSGIKTGPFQSFVCTKAVIDYLAKDKDIVTSIVQNTDVRDFVITCKRGGSFNGTVQRMSDGSEVELFKSNRVIATNDTSYGMLYKYKDDEKGRHYTKMPDIPEHCLTVNKDLNTYDMSKLRSKIDYNYYLTVCEDLLHYQFYQLCGDKLFRTHQFDYFQ